MTLKRFIKYVATGGTAFVIEFTGYYFLMKLVPYLAANIIVYSLTFWFVFLVNKYWTFSSQGNTAQQLKRYLVLYAVNLILGNFFLYLFTSVIGIHPYVSKVMVTGMTTAWNFVLYNKIIYV